MVNISLLTHMSVICAICLVFYFYQKEIVTITAKLRSLCKLIWLVRVGYFQVKQETFIHLCFLMFMIKFEGVHNTHGNISKLTHKQA